MNEKECAISYAVLHGPLFIPGADGRGINLGPTLSSEAIAGTSKGLKMTLKDNFLYLEVKGGSTLVPMANVMHMVPAKQA